MSRIHYDRPSLQYGPQRVHVVKQVLKHSSSFAQNAVATEHCAFFQQAEDHMIGGMARSMQNAKSGPLNCKLLSILQRPDLWMNVVVFKAGILPNFAVL